MKYNHSKAEQIYNSHPKKDAIYNEISQRVKKCFTLPGLVNELGEDISNHAPKDSITNYTIIVAEALYKSLGEQEVLENPNIKEKFSRNDQTFGMILNNLFYPLDSSQDYVIQEVENTYLGGEGV